MRLTLGTSGPQRQILYSASKGIFVWPHTEEMISFPQVASKKNTYKKIIKTEHFRFLCSHSMLPTKMTYGNLFILVFWSPIAVGHHSVLPTKMTYGNLFVFDFLESHSG